MSYRFKVERGWASSGYGAKAYWNAPEVFQVLAETEKEATDKVSDLSDTGRLGAGNRYLYRVVSAEELPPEPEPAVGFVPYPYQPSSGHQWRGTSRSTR